MAFTRVDDELRRDAECAQGVPKFVGLCRRTFRVAFADDDQRRRLYILDELDRATFVVSSRILINGCAEERNHPLVDEILAVITLPVANPRAGYGRFESIGLGDVPHRHESAITPAGHAQAIWVDRIFFDRGVDTGEIVAQIAMAEIFHVGAREIFTLTMTAARIRKQHEITAR